MGRRLAASLTLLLLLAGCGPDLRQVSLCESILPALLADDAKPTELRATADPAVAHGLLIVFRTGVARRQLGCEFGGGRLSQDRLSLRQVSLDGEKLSFERMVFLWRAFDLTAPIDLVAPTPPEQPMPPARAAAYLAQQLINGLTLGSVLALIAVGYSLVYGVTGTIQFAFGEVFMIGAYLVMILMTALAAIGIGFLPVALALTLIGAGALAAVHGCVIERLIYRPLRRAGSLAPLIAAIGLSIALREYVRLAQGGRDKWLANPLPIHFTLFEGGGFPVTMAGTQMLIMVLAVAVSVALGYFMLHTRFGRAQRACADDPVMAALLGIDVDGTISAAFALGAVLAALAGLVVALYYGEADPFIGYLAGFKALTAALLGGFGSISGALLGGLLLGVFEALWSG